MPDTCDRCHRPKGREPGECDPCPLDGGLACRAAQAVWQTAKLAEQAAEIERLTRELAEATKPRWVGRVLIAPKLEMHEIAEVWPWECEEGCGAPPEGCVHYAPGHAGTWTTTAEAWVRYGYATEAEARAAAEEACGVEVGDG